MVRTFKIPFIFVYSFSSLEKFSKITGYVPSRVPVYATKQVKPGMYLFTDTFISGPRLQLILL